MKIKYLLLLNLIFLLICCKDDGSKKENLIQENVNIAKVEQGLLPNLILKGDTIASYSLKKAMEENNVPGVSIAVINNGKIDWAKGYGIANTKEETKVDTSTIFQAASISKPITALAILKMMEEGKVHLDSNVNKYLTTWKVPENKFTAKEKVTLRGLLTHSAGTTVHGFPGYKPTDTFPTTRDVLEGKGNTAAVVVDTIPGSRTKYSGGGYTIVQKVIEDLTNTPFETYMNTEILRPLGMLHSTFAQPLPNSYKNHASAAYDSDGKIIEGDWNSYPEKAAAGLWTTPSDLARYIIAMQKIKAGKKNGLLLPSTVTEMLTLGAFEHGLGPALVEEDNINLFVHGGKNAGFTNVFVAYVNDDKGLVIMTNADNGGALLGAIEKAVSKAYDWNLSEPKVIDPIFLDSNYLQKFTGTYTYIEQVPSAGGDYIAKVRVENGELIIYDVPEDKDYHFVATDSLQFIDIKNGDRVSFKFEENDPILWWNNTFEFRKN